MYGCESWTVKKAEHWRIDAFELWCWRRLLRVPWTARRFNKSVLNDHWKDWCWSWNSNTLATWCEDPDAGKDWGQEQKGAMEDEMVGWHHRLNGHEFEQAPGDSEGQGNLACCSPWGCKQSDMTAWLNNNKAEKPTKKTDYVLKCLTQLTQSWTAAELLSSVRRGRRPRCAWQPVSAQPDPEPAPLQEDRLLWLERVAGYKPFPNRIPKHCMYFIRNGNPQP